jgi:hypothetical protein
VVTAAEEMPMQEGLELLDRLHEELLRDAAAVVVNGLYPPAPATPADPGDALGLLWRRRRAVNDRELERLHAAWRGPGADLPLLPLESGPQLLAALLPHLREGLRA